MKEENTEHTARITPDEVVEAYEETGWIPISRELETALLTVDGVATGGCGIGVLGEYWDLIHPTESRPGHQYGKEYLDSFMLAFDEGFECEDEDEVEEWLGKMVFGESRPCLGMIDGSWSGFKAKQLRAKSAAARKEELATA